ncbi:speckle-type POZ protein-like B [Bradysia coprophila]|uniref:speckle-type POZ protein-like B n=1 Tax=Bradysia coprophila TaxID=38358 RepID=UPI00187D7A0E|nr:speckle-type POZ protein-like B [Bradysia coprophila]
MDYETRQFVKRKKLQPVERKSSLYMKVVNFGEFDWNEKIDSEKISFLDGDDVWWLSLKKMKQKDLSYINIQYFIETSDYIWQSGMGSLSISGNINEVRICKNQCKIDQITGKLTEINDDFIMKLANVVEIKLTVTISQSNIPSHQLPIHKLIDSTVQYKKILCNNKKLLNDPKYSDFTFVVQDEKYKVHKNILASASPVFDKLFTSKFRENETNECCVEAIEPTIFQYLLNFIYSGELPEQLNGVSRALFEAAHYYQINELADICLSVECYHLSKDNAVVVYEWADKMNLENVKKSAWPIIQFEILDICEEIPPPPFQSVESMIKNKIENDELLKQYRLKVSELKNVTKDLFK